MEVKIKNQDEEYVKNLMAYAEGTFANQVKEALEKSVKEPFKIVVKKGRGANSPVGVHLEGKIKPILIGYVSLGKDLANILKESDKDFFEFCGDIANFMEKEKCEKK